MYLLTFCDTGEVRAIIKLSLTLNHVLTDKKLIEIMSFVVFNFMYIFTCQN